MSLIDDIFLSWELDLVARPDRVECILPASSCIADYLIRSSEEHIAIACSFLPAM